ncbi:leucine-rich repeat domain-containing protein [Andreprevotia chitinilytica]|uniref:leucine-rich repeat domain-containing protein n=1 Tax=Andreprevotia chitinilytica TaxID=396808 RepID=UPI00054D77F2|nr:hypothetical protein [Andreprevotia chitinilytica]
MKPVEFLLIENPTPVKDIFPDSVFAQLAAAKISDVLDREVTVEDEVVQDELDQVKEFLVFTPTDEKAVSLGGVGYFRNLEKLMLESHLIEALPEELGTLTNLSILVLTSNRIKSIPSWIGNLTQLTRLHLDSQTPDSESIPGLSGEVPESIGRLTKLEHLALHNNLGLTGKLPESLVQLTALQGLPIQTNAFEDLTVLNRISPSVVVNAINQALGKVDLGVVAADSVLQVKLPVIFVQAQTEGDVLYDQRGIEINHPDALIGEDHLYVDLPTNQTGDQEVTLQFASNIKTSITYTYKVE